MQVLVETSARHIHLSEEIKNILFGEDYEISLKRSLSQPGQFLCNEKVDIVGPRGIIKGVSILGPLRSKTQVEISLTDARKIGIEVPIRESGDLSGSAGCEIIGPKGRFNLNEGLIVAKRHIHVPLEISVINSLQDGQIVSVKIESRFRSAIFDDVVIRVSNKFRLAMHIDTDESNALGLNAKTPAYGEIILKNE